MHAHARRLWRRVCRRFLVLLLSFPHACQRQMASSVCPRLHQSCDRSRTGRHFCFEVVYAGSGEPIPFGMFDTRIHDNTNLAWVVRCVSHQIGWPVEYISVVIGTHRWMATLQNIRWMASILLQSLRRECMHQGSISEEASLLLFCV